MLSLLLSMSVTFVSLFILFMSCNIFIMSSISVSVCCGVLFISFSFCVFVCGGGVVCFVCGGGVVCVLLVCVVSLLGVG